MNQQLCPSLLLDSCREAVEQHIRLDMRLPMDLAVYTTMLKPQIRLLKIAMARFSRLGVDLTRLSWPTLKETSQSTITPVLKYTTRGSQLGRQKKTVQETFDG